MVGVAQLVEPRVVIPVVVGSSPIVHPNQGPAGASSRALAGKDGAGKGATFAGGRKGRRPFLLLNDGPLAQLVEQLTLNQLVVGSIPTRPTTPSKTHYRRSEPAARPAEATSGFTNISS